MSTHHTTIGNIARILLFVPAILIAESQPIPAQMFPGNPADPALTAMVLMTIQQQQQQQQEQDKQQEEQEHQQILQTIQEKIKAGDFNFAGFRINDIDFTKFGASLSDANFKGATLSEVNLSGIELTHTNMEGATLFEVNLRGANLTGANFINIRADHVSFDDSIMSGVRLEGAKLEKRVSFVNAKLDGVSFVGADLRGANLKGAYLPNSDLSGADLTIGWLSPLPYTNLSGTCLSNVTLTPETSFKRVDLRGANLSGTEISNPNQLKGAFVTPGAHELDNAVMSVPVSSINFRFKELDDEILKASPTRDKEGRTCPPMKLLEPKPDTMDMSR